MYATVGYTDFPSVHNYSQAKFIHTCCFTDSMLTISVMVRFPKSSVHEVIALYVVQ